MAIPDCRDMDSAVEQVKVIYRAVQALEARFPGRRFTPDGHMVGSLGEVWARWLYNLMLLPNSAETHDATCPNGRRVQIKTTQGERVAISSEPEHLIVLSLKDGVPSEIYNGPGARAWQVAGGIQKNGQRPVSLAVLKKLMSDVPQENRVPPCNHFSPSHPDQ